MTEIYQQRGVSSDKLGVHKATAGLNKGLYPGAFCQIMPYKNMLHAVKHADGAGTKAVLAYLAWKYAGFPISIWRGITQDSIVMNTDDVACVGALRHPAFITQGINRNTFCVGDDVLTELVAGGKDFVESMSRFGFNLVLSGGETADVPDAARTITVDNDIFTVLLDSEVIDARNIEAGDVIVGFSSTGQAAWETEPNSGIGSNGLTNARHDVLDESYREYTETYSPEMPSELVYRGKYRLNDDLPGDKRFTIGSALLSPTRTYIPLIAQLLKIGKPHALIHCSGGGQTKIGKFGPPDVVYRKANPFPIPPLFKFLQQARGLRWWEMYKSYNMGHRLEAVVSRELADPYIDMAAKYNIEAQIVGRVVSRDEAAFQDKRVVISSPFGVFAYK